MSEILIRVMRTPSEREDFITFAWKVYKDNPYWVPPLINERKDFLNPEKNPFFEHAVVEYFMAFRGDEPVGTIAAFTNSAYNEFQSVNIGFFGFFEVLEDREAAHALLLKTGHAKPGMMLSWARRNFRLMTSPFYS